MTYFKPGGILACRYVNNTINEIRLILTVREDRVYTYFVLWSEFKCEINRTGVSIFDWNSNAYSILDCPSNSKYAKSI